MAADYLADLLDALLDEAAFALSPARTGHPAPTRQLVAHSAPAVDVCTDDGLLAVYLDRAPHVHPQARGRLQGRCQVAVTADLVVEVWRCYPTMQDDGSPWPPATTSAASTALAIDLWCLLTHLHVAWQQGDLMPGIPASCQHVTFGTATPLGPSGGAAGWRVPINYVLNDPDPSGIAS